ncbi:hypothetical protein BDV33DRAFT_203380 [Aspergillus novoparasiticus]|uniref:Uncharacterized protein n=1 Tax=Aspergillus novoparasiticus TaxID=986946 RepID=A0A5N6EU10_9EURO|nr:hypothetical protein BDV33DRAFT_203380 [Aspergillus novoparasiticus]
MLPKRTINNFPLKIRYEIFILAMTPPHAEWLDHPIIYLKKDRVRKVVWRDLDPTYHNLLLTDKMCHWTAQRALSSHFVFMYAEPFALELPHRLRRNIKHFAYCPDLMHDTSHFFNLIDIRRQLSYLTTVHIVIPPKGERISQRIMTDAETLKFIALFFLMRYRVAVVGQAEQDGCWDIESGQALYSVRNALRGLEGYRHLNMFYNPHDQNLPIEVGGTDALWTREEDLGLLEDRKPVVSELEKMALIPRMRGILSLMSTYSGI